MFQAISGREGMEEHGSLLPVPRKWVVVVVGSGKSMPLQASFPLSFHLVPHLGDSAAQLIFRDGFLLELLFSYHYPQVSPEMFFTGILKNL